MIKQYYQRFELQLYVYKKILEESRELAIEFYQALCNTQWINYKTKEEYSCSWRYAGGLIADIRDKEEGYLDYYCSGNEGFISELVRILLFKLGWIPNENDYSEDEKMEILIIDLKNDCYQVTKNNIYCFRNILIDNHEPQIETIPYKTSGRLLDFFKNKMLTPEQKLELEKFIFEYLT